MLELWLRFVKILKSLIFDKKEESNIFSDHFNFKRWSLFILIIAMITSTVFITYRLFVISSKYLNLENQYKLSLSLCKKKTLDYDKFYKFSSKDIEVNESETQTLARIYRNLNTTYPENKKILSMVTNMVQLIEMNNNLLSQNINTDQSMTDKLNACLLENKK